MIGTTAGARELRLLVPPSVQHLRAVRLVAADTAGRAGFDCEQTDDVRIAVDELCHGVMRYADGPITLVFAADDGRVTIEGSARRNPGEAPLLDPLSDAILHSVSQFFEIVDCPPDVRFMLVMERHPACP
jgi:anti-sigma regulatory factor (Ser/Thr protein kinase)